MDELIMLMIEDRMHVAETLGVGPSGIKSADRTLLANPYRKAKFDARLQAQTEIIEVLRSLQRG